MKAISCLYARFLTIVHMSGHIKYLSKFMVGPVFYIKFATCKCFRNKCYVRYEWDVKLVCLI